MGQRGGQGSGRVPPRHQGEPRPARGEVPPVRRPVVLDLSGRLLLPQDTDQQLQLGTQLFRRGIAKQPFKPQKDVRLGERMGRLMRAGLIHFDEPVF
jgi:hypothetical protein